MPYRLPVISNTVTWTKLFAAVSLYAVTGYASIVHAAMVNFTLTGVVDILAEPGNGFGLALGDTISLTGTFDDASPYSYTFTSGPFAGQNFVSFNSGSGNSFTINAGNQTFIEKQDYDWGYDSPGGYPNLRYEAGNFVNLDFASYDLSPAGPYFHEYDFQSGSTFHGLENEATVETIAGTWNTLQLVTVPISTTFWLFGSGLLGLIRIATRKQTARHIVT